MTPTVEELRALGYVIQLGGGTDYHRVPLKHPALHYSLAKLLITDTPEDAYLRSAAGRELDDEDEPEDDQDEPEEASDAKKSGTLLDVLLTEAASYDPSKLAELPYTAQLKTKTDVVHYRDWRRYRVISASSWSKEATKQCRSSALDIGLTPILEHKLLKAMRRVEAVRARLELAGVSFEEGRCQVPVFWVEIASDGTPVQCAARLDQLLPVGRAGEPWEHEYVIRDLKETRSLRPKAWANQVYDLRYHLQATAYKRGVYANTGIHAEYEWVLVRSGSIAVARRAPSREWIEMGEAEWSHAVDVWAKCVKSGMWPGYELRGVETTYPEPYQLTRHEEWKQTIEDNQEEAEHGNVTAA